MIYKTDYRFKVKTYHKKRNGETQERVTIYDDIEYIKVPDYLSIKDIKKLLTEFIQKKEPEGEDIDIYYMEQIEIIEL